MTALPTLFGDDVVDNVDSVMAEHVNNLRAWHLAASGLALNSLSSALTTDVTLSDTDAPVQFYDCGGAARNVFLPAESTDNHPFYIGNTSTDTSAVTVMDDSGVTTIAEVAQGYAGLFISDGAAWRAVSGGGGGAATQIIETGGPTTLDIGAISDGQFLKRSGTGVIGATLNGWLPAAGTWTFSSADAPSYVVSVNADMTGIISVGMKIKLTHATVKYFIVTVVGAYSGGNTLITLYGGTDYTLAAAGDPITSPYFSTENAPFGFPRSPTKWSETFSDTTQRTQASPSNGVWYNLGGLTKTIPIGVWKLKYSVVAEAVSNASQTSAVIFCTLSDTNNGASDSRFTGAAIVGGASSVVMACATVCIEALVVLAAKTPYYINAMCNNSVTANLYFQNSFAAATITATCAYL